MPAPESGSQDLAAASASAPGASRRGALTVAAILLVSIAIRLPNLSAPVLERHDFRQTQTAITVQAWLDRGFTLDYETPVFGPPWRAPFEFPTFQASIYPLARAGVPLDLACRITALLWFYASALLLFAAARRFAGARTATATLAMYVLSPFSITWSRACLIDYASIALSLGWLLALASWASRRRAAAAVAAVVLGAFAAATKVTTIAAFLPAVAIVSFAALRLDWRLGTRRRVAALGGLAAILALPLAVAVVWTRWADSVKESAPATRWLTSPHLVEWNFGTLAQRWSAGNWADILVRVRWVVPGLFLAALVFAVRAVWRRSGSARLAVAAALTGALVGIGTFFNLYWVHDYYLIAVTPCLALAAGTGIDEILSLRIPRRPLVLGALLVAALATTSRHFRYAGTAYEDTRLRAVVRLARMVELVTPLDRWIVVEGDDWNPRIPYLSHRRAFMIRPPFVSADLVASRPEVATIVCMTCPPDLLSIWPNRTWVGREATADVFRVSPQAAGAGAGR